MSTTIAINPPSASSAFITLLRADLTTQWRNRRASMMSILLPVIILMSWKGLIPQFGGAFVLSNCITVGLTALGLMGYSTTIARDRDKGIFQRLRVAPAPNWTIMASRLSVQLIMIIILTAVVFIIGAQFDHITLTASGYALGMAVAIVGGAVYLSLGQLVVGLVMNPETVQSTARLVYIAFIMIGMFGEFGMLGKEIGDFVKWSPYGTTKRIVSAAVTPSTWDAKATMAFLVTIGYTIVFATVGIRKFRWTSR
jgi:ABC-2 type transport system permease protein